ncbi:MAG: glutathione S-transferase N-terminal domain-containing protein [Rhodobacteraceae bacterium]|nr:glutathione S-transferase N-terminal domain-containing protein [Paracoccaceae bacterium]
MPEYRLHCFAQSGNAYKVALMLNLCEVKWTPVFVDFFHGAHRTPEFLKLNPMGEVPVLEGPEIHGHRQILTQSGSILHHLSGELAAFGGQNEGEREEILRWMFWDNHKLTSYTATHRFMTNFVPEEKRSADVIAFLKGRRDIAFKVLEARLGEQDFVATPDEPSIADISCCGYLFWLDEMGVDPADVPNIWAWLRRIKALKGWVAPYELMPGHPLPGKG